MNNEYNYDFDQKSSRQKQNNGFGFWLRVLGAWFGHKMRSPVFATTTLLIAGVAFAVIVMMSYPDGENDMGDVPIVKADASPFKETPGESGGMDVPYRDSTVFQAMRDGSLENRPVIENLLAPDEEKLEDVINITEQPRLKAAPEAVTPTESTETASTAEPEKAPEPASATQEQKTEEVKQAATETTKEPEETAAVVPTTKPKTIHAAGSSPETIEFVRSILEHDDESANGVEPAAGAATGAGSAYVQLGSVRAESGAKAEWGNLQKAFPALQGLPYRVQKADLGAKGIYYRIQAGPMNESGASSLCDKIKSQKPGGCLVVK